MESNRSEFAAGVRAIAPLLLGAIPFGLIYGALAAQLQVPAAIAQAMSSIVFAGSAQFIGVPLIESATPAIVFVLTVFVVNLRHALYSASVAPYLERLSPLWKALLAYLLTDEAYAVTIVQYQRGDGAANKHWFFLGAGLALWTSWQTSTAVGIFVGAQVPASWSLDFALPLTFIAIVVPMLKNRAYVTAALVAGIVGVLSLGLPYKLGLMLAAMSGIASGMAVDRASARTETTADRSRPIEQLGEK